MIKESRLLQFCEKCDMMLGTLDHIDGGVLKCPRCGHINELKNYNEQQLNDAISSYHERIREKIKPIISNEEEDDSDPVVKKFSKELESFKDDEPS